MTLVKKFNDFMKPEIGQEINEDITPVTQEKAKEGELTRWSIVLRDRKEGAVNVVNPSETMLDFLVRDPEFKKWWTNGKYSPTGLTVTSDTSLGVIYSGVSNKTNLIGQKVYKADIVFLPYVAGQSGGDTKNGLDVKYDVTKAKPVTTQQVLGSEVPVALWSSADLDKLKLKATIGYMPATDRSGNLITPDKVNPIYVSNNGASEGTAPSSPSIVATPVNTKTAEVTADQTTATATSSSSTGLKATQAFDQKIQDLQKKIIASGNVEAAKAINDKGGAIGKYGSGTAKAIGILTGTNKEEREITPELAAKLDAALKNVTPEQIAAVKVPAAKTTSNTTSAKPAEASKSTGISVTTPKGKNLIFK